MFATEGTIYKFSQSKKWQSLPPGKWEGGVSVHPNTLVLLEFLWWSHFMSLSSRLQTVSVNCYCMISQWLVMYVTVMVCERIQKLLLWLLKFHRSLTNDTRIDNLDWLHCAQYNDINTELPTLTHWAWVSRISPHSHADMLISHGQKNTKYKIVRGLWYMYEGYPYYVSAKSRQKFWGQKKKCRIPPPPFFLDLRDFIGWQRTALAFLTPNPHPMLAALLICCI